MRAARSARTKGATLVLARLGNAAAQLNLSVSPTRLRHYCCAVRRDERHTVRAQPRRKALRCSYPFCQRRCAATATQSGRTKGSYPAGQMRRKETHPHHPCAPLPPLREGACLYSRVEYRLGTSLLQVRQRSGTCLWRSISRLSYRANGEFAVHDRSNAHESYFPPITFQPRRPGPL